MNRVFKTLATAVVVLALLVPTTYAAPKREVVPERVRSFVQAIRDLVIHALDGEMSWPKP